VSSAWAVWDNRLVMSVGGSGHSRAAELAAQQVESIVSAAQAAADEVKLQAEQEAEAIRAQGRQEAGAELERARTEAVQLGQEARKDAKSLVDDAERESAQIREQTQRAVEGKVADAEERAEQVLAEAETLSTGLRRLGETLSDQGGRILRDVQSAHRRMQADLRVAPSGSERPRSSRSPGEGARDASGGRSRNPLEDLEVPNWVGRER
jgi:hypothetical protein